MEEDSNEGPFAVWQMFNAPILILFNNLEHAADGLDRLLTSILKLSGDFSEVLVSRSGVLRCPVSYYCAFNTWLLGRLFYVCSVEELTRLHSMCKDAQLKILNIVCINSAPFYCQLHSQYFLTLMKLFEYYKNFSNNNEEELELRNFTPEHVQIPNVDINLEPIYVKVKDLKTSKTLIYIILELLSESIPSSLMQFSQRDLEEQTFLEIINAIQNCSMDVKVMCLNFFLNLIKNVNKISVIRFNKKFNNISKNLLTSIESLVKDMDILHDKCEIDNSMLENLNLIIFEFLTIFEDEAEMESSHIFSEICSVILNNRIFSKDIKLYCVSLSTKYNIPKELLKMCDMDSCEIAKLNFYSKEIQREIETLKKTNKRIDLNENWHYKQVISVINCLQFCEKTNIDVLVINEYLEKSQKALEILEVVMIESKRVFVKEEKPYDIISKQNIQSIWTTLVKIQQKYKASITNSNIHKSLVQLVLSTINLCNNYTTDEISCLLRILCLQGTQSPEGCVSLTIKVKLIILKSLLIAKIHIKSKMSDWDKAIAALYSSLLKNKDSFCLKEIINLSPLLIINKVVSASKVMEDSVIPYVTSSPYEVQKEILLNLSTIACMSFGTYNIVVNTAKNSTGHVIHINNGINIILACTRCHNLIENSSSETVCLQVRKNYKVLHSESNSITPTKISTHNRLKNSFGIALNLKLYDADEFWTLVRILSNHYCIFESNVSTDIINGNCLKEVLQVFKPFLNETQSTRYPEWNAYRETLTNLCINLLGNLTRTILQENNYNLQSQTLDYIKELGLCQNVKLILPVTRLLVSFIMHRQCPLASKATCYLREVCEFQNFTPNQIYHRYKKDYCKLFVACSLWNSDDFVIYLLKAVKAFGFVGYRDFISKDVHHFLPYLIPYSLVVKEVPTMIEELAVLAQYSVSDFIIERFPHIYVHVYLNESNEAAKKCYKVIEGLTKVSILNLIKKHFRVILTEFLLQYCINPERVLNACKFLACHDPDVSTSQFSMSMSTSQVADFLNPKFLGVLAYFDHKMVNAKVALSVKRKALQSFPDIMQLMGAKYLTPLRFKVLATLRSALPLVKEFPKIVADAWGAFIYNIDSICLGPLLSNLAVSLLHQFEYAPQDINKIFYYLVLKNENLLSSHIPDLFFVGDSNVSEKVKLVIKEHVKRTQPERFHDKIKWYLQHLNHDIPSIKAHAFLHLDELLKRNRPEIHTAIFGSKNIDPVIVELIDCLIVGCKDSDPQVVLASGSCLGQMGAIEAGHLPRQYVQDRSPFAFTINDNCFAATALVELTRAFRYEKDTINMDSYALTIQEILKIYDISPNGSKKEVWDSFPENMHQIMHPLLSSRYTLAHPSQPKKIHPLFGSVYATTFLEWAHNWAGQLIPLIESESIRELLRTVHPSMRRDIRTLFLFLPYVLLHAVMSHSNMQYVREEMEAVIGLENIQNDNSYIAVNQNKYKMLRNFKMSPHIYSMQAEEGNQRKCRKTIYTLLDFLNRWLLEWTHVKQRPMENENYKSIKKFISTFNKLVIARGNYACGELERALQYLEMYMDENKEKMQEQLPLLAEIYAQLDEPDSVAGILSIKRSESSLKELILTQVVTGRLQDATLCYERLAQEGQLDVLSLQGMIDCYLSLDQPFTAYKLLSERDSVMKELTAEPLWRLSRFDQLEKLVDKPVPPSRENWGLLIGKILIAYRKQDIDMFKISCDNAKSKLLLQMDGESRGESALKSGYQSILGLHIITEAGHVQDVLGRLKQLDDNNNQSIEIIKVLLSEWRQRLSLVQSDVRTVEPLLRLRRIFLQQTQELLEITHPITASNLKACIGELWLQSAKHARKAGIFQQSYTYILNAEKYKPEELFIEKAKIFWSRGQEEDAFTTLRRGLEDTYPQLETLTKDQRKICAKAKFLIAKYNDETTKVDVDVNIGYYKESVEVFKEWEKSLVSLGAYYEKVSNNDSAKSSTIWSRRLYALNSYGKSLQYGHKYLYQSMPRMLSIWLDVEVTSSDVGIHSVLAQMTEVIKTFSERLPIYLYLTAFSQIVSRICHPVKEVYLQLKEIIVKLIVAYPQHTMWMMMSVIKSEYQQRNKRCKEVLSDPRLKEPHLLRLISDFTQLAEKMIELCNKPIVTSGSTTTVTSLVRSLPHLLAGENFSHIMMPFQEFCKIVLPSKAARQERIGCNIPNEPEVYIAGIEEQITILPSLQKPRKVTLRGSDGKFYIIMLKPRDDLRKDFRLMEFNAVVNRFLQDAPETRRRRLYIRTYSVLPLNEECGIIEWVPNLVGLRPVLLHIYKQKGIHTTNRELKDMMCSKKDTFEKKRRIYEEQLLPRHPPVFQEWFRRVFSDPYGWYQARSAYIRTTAVMSMIGYILGLGDRHGENISFDSTNGDTVHVDFNCLFNKGESFEWPERVPFRLTHNMESAMGPLKHEGMYRKSCEAVMRVLRSQTAALMSVIGPFVYDPLVSWGARHDHRQVAERTNDQALHHLSQIRQRLNGMIKTKNKQLSQSLSAEGQVEHLIVEATSVENLCQMYIGWGPFL